MNDYKKLGEFVLDETCEFLIRWSVTKDSCQLISLSQANVLANFILQMIQESKKLEKLTNDKI